MKKLAYIAVILFGLAHGVYDARPLNRDIFELIRTSLGEVHALLPAVFIFGAPFFSALIYHILGRAFAKRPIVPFMHSRESRPPPPAYLLIYRLLVTAILARAACASAALLLGLAGVIQTTSAAHLIWGIVNNLCGGVSGLLTIKYLPEFRQSPAEKSEDAAT
jgi:hypothetical protein